MSRDPVTPVGGGPTDADPAPVSGFGREALTFFSSGGVGPKVVKLSSELGLPGEADKVVWH